ncbi:unnamed protein product [Lactuca saligna]|uniref:Uncharacterized protein n=1 Tax=Lactuca saligna TaxID=75948 RepID=A0AA36A149_LACSI|nr:unnamed protein product [Lactuca saligna]
MKDQEVAPGTLYADLLSKVVRMLVVFVMLAWKTRRWLLALVCRTEGVAPGLARKTMWWPVAYNGKTMVMYFSFAEDEARKQLIQDDVDNGQLDIIFVFGIRLMPERREKME